jgi:hypothetical protein
MRMLGFNAEASLAGTANRYKMGMIVPKLARDNKVVPQAWTDCCRRPGADWRCKLWLAACCLYGDPSDCHLAVYGCGCFCCPRNW